MSHPSSSTAGHGGLLSKLRVQAETALSKVPQFDEVQHAVRQGYVQANPLQNTHTLKIQLAIKGAKGVIVDEEGLARETKSYSKNILDFARQENLASGVDNADLQDVGDRLAFLTYKTGELHLEYAKRLEHARGYLKDIRNHENTLTSQRDRRFQLEKDIEKLRTHSKPDPASQIKLTALQADLDQCAGQTSPLALAEVQALCLRRQKLAKSFELQFDALQELGEKMAIISGYGKSLISGWDISEQAGMSDYIDGERTAAVRFDLEKALSGWRPTEPYVPIPNIKAGQNSSAPSLLFYESHGSELAGLSSMHDPQVDHALGSYDHQGSSSLPLPPRRNQYPSSSATNSHEANERSESFVPLSVPDAFGTPGSQGIEAGQGSSSTFVQQLNNAPVTSLHNVSPNEGMGVNSGLTINSLQDAGVSESYTASGSLLSSIAPSGRFPTVAETGAPVIGTGGPSSGVLRPPTHPAISREDRAIGAADSQLHRISDGKEMSAHSNSDMSSSLRERHNQSEQLPPYAPNGSPTSGGHDV